MRYFWSLILVLAVVTGGMFTLRVSRERADVTPVVAAGTPAAADGAFPQRAARPAPSAPTAPAVPAADPAPVAAASDPAAPAELALSIDPQPLPPVASGKTEAVSEAPAEVAAVAPSTHAAPAVLTDSAVNESTVAEVAAADPTLDDLLGVAADDREEATPSAAETSAVKHDALPEADPMMDATLAANAPAEIAPETPATSLTDANAPAPAASVVGPAFEVRADGSLSVEGVGVVPGDGSTQRPFVLDWEVLRSVQRAYNPRQGQSEVPGWLKAIDGKQVRIEGNTLLPVVSQTTTELLVMQNPWDGCCLGVPPTPYDAIEVKLATAQRMGNSPTGFGQVEGVFKVDPYIVSGWLLGLYLVEDAAFKSAAGIVLPEI